MTETTFLCLCILHINQSSHLNLLFFCQGVHNLLKCHTNDWCPIFVSFPFVVTHINWWEATTKTRPSTICKKIGLTSSQGLTISVTNTFFYLCFHLTTYEFINKNEHSQKLGKCSTQITSQSFCWPISLFFRHKFVDPVPVWHDVVYRRFLIQTKTESSF